jgi:hypothetical protein
MNQRIPTSNPVTSFLAFDSNDSFVSYMDAINLLLTPHTLTGRARQVWTVQNMRKADRENCEFV